VLTAVKTYTLDFISDGIATVLDFDCSLAPISEDFRGNIPTAILLPNGQGSITASGGAIVPTFTAAIAGTSVELTFASAPPQYDSNDNLVYYTFTFALEFPN